MARKKVLNPSLSLSNINDISTIFPDLMTGEIIINTNSEKKSLITLDDNSNFIKFIDEEQIDDKISDSLKESKEYADSKVIGLASKEWVENEISQIDLGDLSGFVTEKDIEDMATKSWIKEQNYLTEHQDISGLATKDEASEAATQALENAKADAEAKYQVKGNYEAAGAAAAVKTWVEEQKYLTEHQDISGLATKVEVAEAVSEMATEAWVKEQNYLTEHQDISGLATKGEVASAQAAAEAYADGLAGNYDEAGAAAAVKTWIEEQNYLTEHQDISGLATKDEVDILVSGDTGKSIRYIALEEVVKVVSGAPESFDTLKEIADWITNDTTGAAKMANDIEALKVISGNPSYVNIQSDWLATATTDASYIKNKPTITGSTILGVTGNTINLFSLTGGTLNEYSIDKVPSATTADKAFKDGDGNNIVNTYATKSSVAQSNWSETGSTMPSYIKNKPVISNYTLNGVTGNTLSFASTKENENDLNISFDKVPSANQAMSANTVFVAKNTQNKILYLTGVDSINSSSYDNIYKDEQIYTSGGCLFATSDERLKYFHGDIECDFEKLKNIPKQYFTWKDSENKGMQLGTSAQKVKELYPEIVSIDENGTHSVAYDRLSIIALAAIDKLYEENKMLKERLKKIEEHLGL